MTNHKLQPQIDELRKDIMQLQEVFVHLANRLHELLAEKDEPVNS